MFSASAQTKEWNEVNTKTASLNAKLAAIKSVRITLSVLLKHDSQVRVPLYLPQTYLVASRRPAPSSPHRQWIRWRNHLWPGATAAPLKCVQCSRFRPISCHNTFINDVNRWNFDLMAAKYRVKNWHYNQPLKPSLERWFEKFIALKL